MELRHLRYFVAVAQESSFTRAAERLHISQPPLSQQIADLEGELGTPLFLRTSRRVELTAAGTAFLEHAKAVLERVEQARSQAQAIGSGSAGHLDIGLSGSLLLGPLPQLIAAYRRSHPTVAVVLHEMTPAAQLAGLLDGKIAMSLSRTALNDELLVSELVWEDPVVVALPRGHRMARRRRLDLADLKGEEFVLLRLDSSGFAKYLHASCLEAGFAPNASQQVVESQAIPSLVAAGLGVALVPASMQRVHRRGVEYRPLAGNALRADVYAIQRKDDVPPVVRSFLAEATTVLDRSRYGR
jgi:LysR family transcriptional regulator, benzoate and cis,cis-muconate-responsive activator of ben and cat genes